MKFDLDCLNQWLVHWNLISTALVDGWCTEIWSRRSWWMSGSLKINLNFGWWLIDWNLISTVLNDGWFTEIWSPLSWVMSDSLKRDLDRLGRCLAHLNLISAVLVDGCFTLNLISTPYVDGWFLETWSLPWLMSGSLKFDLNHLW